MRILDGAAELARHARSYDRGQQIEDPAHMQALVEHKRAARPTAAATAWRRPRRPAPPCSQRAAARGDNLGAITAALLRLLERYGAAALQAAILEALERDVPHPNAVRLALERAREAQRPAPAGGAGAARARGAARCAGAPHALASYDRQTTNARPTERRADD